MSLSESLHLHLLIALLYTLFPELNNTARRNALRSTSHLCVDNITLS